MPTPAYLSIEGTSQGSISAGCNTPDSVGNIYQEAHEDEILVEAYGHEITVPTDVQSGQTSGQRMHKPMVITKVFDKSSPLLAQALASGEKMTKCELIFYRTSMDGVQEQYYKIILEDAVITNIRAYMPNCQDPGMAHFTHLEDVAFTYRMITWEHIVAGTSASDDWRAPVE